MPTVTPVLHAMRVSQEWKETEVLKYLTYFTFGNPIETCGHVSILLPVLEEICTSGKPPTSYHSLFSLLTPL